MLDNIIPIILKTTVSIFCVYCIFERRECLSCFKCASA